MSRPPAANKQPLYHDAPSAVVAPLAQQLNGRLRKVLLARGHVEVVHEQHVLGAGGGAVHATSALFHLAVDDVLDTGESSTRECGTGWSDGEQTRAQARDKRTRQGGRGGVGPNCRVRDCATRDSEGRTIWSSHILEE